MKISIKKISGLVSVLVLGLFLASCADDGKNQTYKLGKVSVTAKYENGNPVVGKSLRTYLTKEDILRVANKAEEIAKNTGVDVENLEWAVKMRGLVNNSKAAITDENGKADVPVLLEYGGIKFNDFRTFKDPNGDEEAKEYNINSKINLVFPNP